MCLCCFEGRGIAGSVQESCTLIHVLWPWIRTRSAHCVLKVSVQRQPEESVLVLGVYPNGLIYFATLVRVLKCLNLTGSGFTAAHPVRTLTIRSPSDTRETQREDVSYILSRRAKHCRNHASKLLNCDCGVASLRSAVQIKVADAAPFTVSLRLHSRRCLNVSARQRDAASRLLFPHKPRRPSAEVLLRDGADGATSSPSHLG